MKKILLLLLLTSASVYSQKYVDSIYNFKIEEGNIIWQKVFKSDVKELQKTFIKKTITNIKLENLQEIDQTISFNVVDDMIDFKKYGGKTMTTSFHVLGPKNYLVVIDFKEKKYRVTIKQISIDLRSNRLGISTFEDLFYRKKKIKNTKTSQKDLKYYHRHFIEKFTITDKKDDW
tara:strand:- start:18634 stop:19158 length:525 start_codon:yes stop_codon:yes gene_type:complete